MVLPCYKDKPSRMKRLKVEWRKNDLKDLLHLYQGGQSRTEKQQQEYQDRAHFFTEHLKDGNFSLQLDKLRAEDEGQYTCRVHSRGRKQFSAKINVVLRQLDLYRLGAVYLFGSVGVVLLNSVALMIELILKTVNGEGVTGDMRIFVFSSEFIFTLFLMILMVFQPSAAASDETPASGSNQNQNLNTTESQEMNPLLDKQNQENGRSDTTEENQPDSVVTQS
ncbi:V-set domain-containing T-cell activation inhibitor 1 [Labeo rohita]|uniref:V-set domain-containing T-cell activation inhibitor 1 n=1 Tax=Labeo rohita TaxID=84645 RepID=A0ABQ8L6Q5_LABRO|nr:V-set domain-containing T-cell activation inhibitor 1 [Labeo rohita]